jgi:hypothetical protein
MLNKFIRLTIQWKEGKFSPLSMIRQGMGVRCMFSKAIRVTVPRKESKFSPVFKLRKEAKFSTK